MKRILCLEDCDEWRTYISNLLQYAGYEVHAVATNDDAMRLLLEKPFDLIVQDVQRPPGDCLRNAADFCEDLCGLIFLSRCIRPACPDLPCLFVTAFPRVPYILQELQRLGKARMLRKPLDQDRFFSAVRELSESDEENHHVER